MARMDCGHNGDWVISLVDRGERFTFCLGCLFEKTGLKDINGKETPNVLPYRIQQQQLEEKRKKDAEKKAAVKNKKED